LRSIITATADDSRRPEAPASLGCSSLKHQKLRMLLGKWTITEHGKVVVHNSLTPIFGDCAVREEWR
jgi:hypothetical protein